MFTDLPDAELEKCLSLSLAEQGLDGGVAPFLPLNWLDFEQNKGLEEYLADNRID